MSRSKNRGRIISAQALARALMRPWQERRVALLMMPPENTSYIARMQDGSLEVEKPDAIEKFLRTDHSRILLRVVYPERERIAPTLPDMQGTEDLFVSDIYGWEMKKGVFTPLTAEQITTPMDKMMGYTPLNGYPLLP